MWQFDRVEDRWWCFKKEVEAEGMRYGGTYVRYLCREHDARVEQH